MERIVVIESFGQLRHHRLRVGSIGQFGVVPLQCFHKALGHAVSLRAGHGLESQLLGKAPSFGCCVAAAVVGEPHSMGLPSGPNLFSTACIIKSPTKAASMYLVVATQ